MKGMRPKNHPKQVARDGARDDVDDRWTPDEFFARQHAKHGFTLDAAASAENAKLPRYYTRETDGLAQSWRGERVWCNPPFSALPAWVAKAHDEVAHNGCELVVMLLPANRTEQPWWHEHVEPLRDRGGILDVEFIEKRLRFACGLHPTRPKSGPPFGCCLLVWGKR